MQCCTCRAREDNGHRSVGAPGAHLSSHARRRHRPPAEACRLRSTGKLVTAPAYGQEQHMDPVLLQLNDDNTDGRTESVMTRRTCALMAHPRAVTCHEPHYSAECAVRGSVFCMLTPLLPSIAAPSSMSIADLGQQHLHLQRCHPAGRPCRPARGRQRTARADAAAEPSCSTALIAARGRTRAGAAAALQIGSKSCCSRRIGSLHRTAGRRRACGARGAGGCW